jgi:hypothetical protein
MQKVIFYHSQSSEDHDHNRIDYDQYRYLQKIKRIKTVRIQLTFMVLGLFVAVCSAVILYSSVAKADSGDHTAYKYYKSITISAGATLWTITAEFMDSTYYEDMNDYMDEIIYINRMDSEDVLLAGQSLIIPYYSQEFVP